MDQNQAEKILKRNREFSTLGRRIWSGNVERATKHTSTATLYQYHYKYEIEGILSFALIFNDGEFQGMVEGEVTDLARAKRFRY